jgi:UDP-N-acetylmuramoyl-tripeptide--D-alanyl-D-alanine ligase
LATFGVDHLVVVGDGAAAFTDGARSVAGWSGSCTSIATAEEAATAVEAASGPNDVVLVKASNALRLWRVAELLVGEGAA